MRLVLCSFISHTLITFNFVVIFLLSIKVTVVAHQAHFSSSLTGIYVHVFENVNMCIFCNFTEYASTAHLGVLGE